MIKHYRVTIGLVKRGEAKELEVPVKAMKSTIDFERDLSQPAFTYGNGKSIITWAEFINRFIDIAGKTKFPFNSEEFIEEFQSNFIWFDESEFGDKLAFKTRLVQSLANLGLWGTIECKLMNFDYSLEHVVSYEPAIEATEFKRGYDMALYKKHLISALEDLSYKWRGDIGITKETVEDQIREVLYSFPEQELKDVNDSVKTLLDSTFELAPEDLLGEEYGLKTFIKIVTKLRVRNKLYGS